MNTSIHRRSEVEELLQVPGLAVIPQLPKPGRGFFERGSKGPNRGFGASRQKKGAEAEGSPIFPSAHGLVTVTHSQDRSAEAYRGLRTKLLFLRDKLPLRTLVVARRPPLRTLPPRSRSRGSAFSSSTAT
jgi:hypothetical protein